MRAFLGISLNAQTKLAIESWRNRVFPHFKDSVPAANYHITLAFLGQISLVQQDQLSQEIDQQKHVNQFSVSLDSIGYWSKPKVLWLGCKTVSENQLQLVNVLSKCANWAGINLQKREYQAHLTLVRKCQFNPPAPLITPDFHFVVQAFHLYESVSGHNGVKYVIRNSWPLSSKFSHSAST